MTLEQGCTELQPVGNAADEPSVGLDSAGFKPLQHWLRDCNTWQVLAAAGATHPRKVAATARRLWPHRPPIGTGLRRTYSWPELRAIAAHLSGEVQ